MTHDSTRREWLASAGLVLGAAALPGREPGKELPMQPFGFCLNTSTIESQKLDMVQVVDIAAKAGYQAIEPWVRDLDAHVKRGGSLKELGQRIRDHGLSVPSAIGFFDWIVDDSGRRRKALEEARRNMEAVRQIGGLRLAAPPAGATQQSDLNLAKAAERYAALLNAGDELGVVPQVELWGFSRSLSRLGEVMYVALESGHAKACVLLDVYHLYKGGSNIEAIRLLSGAAMHVLHFNDYPSSPPRNSITDAQRIYPGDGVAPLKPLLRDLRQIGFKGFLSLELFNRDYWKQDPLTVARTGLKKMRALVKDVE